MSKRDQKGVENGVFGGLGTPWEHPGPHLETNMAQGGPRGGPGTNKERKSELFPPGAGTQNGHNSVQNRKKNVVFVFLGGLKNNIEKVRILESPRPSGRGSRCSESLDGTFLPGP